MILLDTHIWLRWLVNDNPLLHHIINLIETGDAIAVSAISIWEAILLHQRKRIELPIPLDAWLNAALDGSDVKTLALTAEIARLAADLPQHHKDPADRFIIATSIANRTKLISFDSVFPAYAELNELLIGE